MNEYTATDCFIMEESIRVLEDKVRALEAAMRLLEEACADRFSLLSHRVGALEE